MLVHSPHATVSSKRLSRASIVFAFSRVGGISYMIAPGGSWASNTDPSGTSEKPDNQWGFDGPHLMIVVPNADALKGLPTTRTSGGPFVMYAGTPYAHIMIPLSNGQAESKPQH
jgi:hypothetical protein